MRDVIACPYCGKKFIAGANTCPHCCEKLPVTAENGTFPMAHSKWESIHRNRKMLFIILGLLLTVFIVSFQLFSIRYCGAVGILDPYTSREYRAKALGPLAEQPAMETEDLNISVKELNALEPKALWLHPEKIKAAHPELTEAELAALDGLCRNTLPFGASWEKCLDILNEKLAPENARRLLDYCRADFQIQALRKALRSMDDENYSPTGLLKALALDGFTEEEAQYALNHCGADWALQTELSAKKKIFYLSISEKNLTNRLIDDGHDPEVISQVLKDLAPDWNREALQAALLWDTRSNMKRTREELLDHLEWKGFTPEQVLYAADLMKLH